jgi:hypothetical protein
MPTRRNNFTKMPEHASILGSSQNIVGKKKTMGAAPPH